MWSYSTIKVSPYFPDTNFPRVFLGTSNWSLVLVTMTAPLIVLLIVDFLIKCKFFQLLLCRLCAVRHQTRTDKKLQQHIQDPYPAMLTTKRRIAPVRPHLNVLTGMMLALIKLDWILDSSTHLTINVHRMGTHIIIACHWMDPKRNIVHVKR